MADARDLQLTQATRIGELKTPLGPDLVLQRFEGREGLSELFEYRVNAISTKPNLSFDKAIGQHCTVSLKTYGSMRHFDGILVEAQWLGGSIETYYTYQLILRPWTWLLSHRSDCKIFHEKSVTDIIQDVLPKSGFSDFQIKASGFSPIEYCVQYRETDLAFVSRLMEQYGLYYFFKHEDGKHTMMIVDRPSHHEKIALPKGNLVFMPNLHQTRRGQELVYHWTAERRFRTGQFAVNDYDYLKPNANLKQQAQGSESYAHKDYEVYDYPGKYVDPGQGEKFAKIRLEAEQALDHRRRSAGDAASLYPGGKTTLEGHQSAEDRGYVVLRCSHTFSTEQYRSGGGSSGEAYAGSYEFLPDDQQFRAPHLTPLPLIHGAQTARVVGKEGEEIDVDEHGRILVHFFWDRHNDKSCRVRIGQPWAQKQWGHIVIPRIGQEVIVEFLEGDPDRPLVTGAVYNGDNKVPYSLPDNKTQSGIKSNSSKGGGGFNEFRLEDKKDSEQVYLRAQKDLDSLIRNKETREIGTVFDTAEGKSSRITKLKHGDDELELETGTRKIKIAVDRKEEIGKNETVKVGQNQKLNVGQNQTVDVGMNAEITAGTKIMLKVGASKITMTPASIKIEAPMIELSGALIKIN